MILKLYPHNKEAYENVEKAYREGNKACIIHPTGTGKSYVAFALMMTHPDKRFLWLSPSEYIYKMQTRKLMEEQGIVFQNVIFHTYTWMMLNQESYETLQPDYIILDEFHRAGAPKWESAVLSLFTLYPNVKVLGLTATNVRYLDHKRDMAQELFDGNVASEITLTQAIAKGILPLPKYVISVYSYQKKIEEYQERIDKLKNEKRKEESNKVLEKLRRSLQKADGMQEIFYKHIKNPSGKYIVFCANTDHLYEMISMVPEWFEKIDLFPHIYHVFTNNPESEDEFIDFVTDRSNHLKLLFAIDMINEGIHVDDVDGVILLRPTISPIVYKQQIGRALAVGTKKSPIIFDLVNNFSSLSYIEDFRDELEEMISLQASAGEHTDADIEAFEIIDELRESRALFEMLQRNLNSTWDDYYKELVKYVEQYKNTQVSKNHITESGLHLGKWLIHQRGLARAGRLDIENLKKLEALGVAFEYVNERRFERWMRLLNEYKEEHGDVNVPNGYITKSDDALGSYCAYIRQRYLIGKLDKEKIKRLENLGFVWVVFTSLWEEGYEHAKEYYERHGHIGVTKRYVCEDGYKLGLWLNTQRRVRVGKVPGDLTNEKIQRLDEIGMCWVVERNDRFDQYIEAYKEYMEKYSTPIVDHKFIDENGNNLGAWVFRMRRKRREGKMSHEQFEKLEEIGFSWSTISYYWDQMYQKAKAYYEQYGHISISSYYVQENGYQLLTWLNRQKKYYNSKNPILTEEKIKLLEDIGIQWRNINDVSFMKSFARLEKYKETFGDTVVPKDYITEDGFKLGVWVAHQKADYNAGRLPQKRVDKLNELGMNWNNTMRIRSLQKWEQMYQKAKEYYEENDHLRVPWKYVTEEGLKLGYWISLIRKVRKGTVKHSVELTKERIKRLEDIGMIWDCRNNDDQK